MNFEDQVVEALVIIQKSFNSGKLLAEFKRWEQLDYEARMTAIERSKCAVCRRVRKLTGTWQHMFGTEPACKDCCDQNNPRLMAFRESF